MLVHLTQLGLQHYLEVMDMLMALSSSYMITLFIIHQLITVRILHGREVFTLPWNWVLNFAEYAHCCVYNQKGLQIRSIATL